MIKAQSFSEKIKEELMSVPTRQQESILEILGIFTVHIKETHIQKKSNQVEVHSDNLYAIYRLRDLFRTVCQRELIIYKSSRLDSFLSITFEEWIKLEHEIVLKKDEIKLDIQESEEICAFLRGCYIGSGYISNPEKSYHFEITCVSEDDALYICRLMAMVLVKAKYIGRKNGFIVYIKEAEQIVNFLAAIGAHQGLLMLENIRIVKEISNSVNRRVNCDAANIKKTVDASIKQVKEIEYLISKIGLDGLPMKLREVARLRLEFPEDTLSEIGEKMNPKVSKSGVYHRLKKIEQMASNL